MKLDSFKFGLGGGGGGGKREKKINIVPKFLSVVCVCVCEFYVSLNLPIYQTANASLQHPKHVKCYSVICFN